MSTKNPRARVLSPSTASLQPQKKGALSNGEPHAMDLSDPTPTPAADLNTASTVRSCTTSAPPPTQDTEDPETLLSALLEETAAPAATKSPTQHASASSLHTAITPKPPTAPSAPPEAPPSSTAPPTAPAAAPQLSVAPQPSSDTDSRIERVHHVAFTIRLKNQIDDNAFTRDYFGIVLSGINAGRAEDAFIRAADTLSRLNRDRYHLHFVTDGDDVQRVQDLEKACTNEQYKKTLLGRISSFCNNNEALDITFSDSDKIIEQNAPTAFANPPLILNAAENTPEALIRGELDRIAGTRDYRLLPGKSPKDYLDRNNDAPKQGNTKWKYYIIGVDDKSVWDKLALARVTLCGGISIYNKYEEIIIPTDKVGDIKATLVVKGTTPQTAVAQLENHFHLRNGAIKYWRIARNREDSRPTPFLHVRLGPQEYRRFGLAHFAVAALQALRQPAPGRPWHVSEAKEIK